MVQKCVKLMNLNTSSVLSAYVPLTSPNPVPNVPTVTLEINYDGLMIGLMIQLSRSNDTTSSPNDYNYQSQCYDYQSQWLQKVYPSVPMLTITINPRSLIDVIIE